MKGIVITTQDEVSVQDFGKPLYKTIGALWDGYIEVVRPRYLERPFVIVIDEEGRLKESPQVNLLPSLWYGAHEHGEPIVGTAVVMKEVWLDNGEQDIVGLAGSEVEYLTAMINKQLDQYGRVNAKKEAARGGSDAANG